MNGSPSVMVVLNPRADGSMSPEYTKLLTAFQKSGLRNIPLIVTLAVSKIGFFVISIRAIGLYSIPELNINGRPFQVLCKRKKLI